MLRACAQALKPGGRIAFLTIQPTPGLDDRRRRVANQLGPQEVTLRTSYQSLLRTAGFSDISAKNVTEEYRSTLRRWIDATETRKILIRKLVGDDVYEQRAANREQDLQAVDDGLLSRFQYTATRRSS